MVGKTVAHSGAWRRRPGPVIIPHRDGAGAVDACRRIQPDRQARRDLERAVETAARLGGTIYRVVPVRPLPDASAVEAASLGFPQPLPLRRAKIGLGAKVLITGAGADGTIQLLKPGEAAVISTLSSDAKGAAASGRTTPEARRGDKQAVKM